MEIIVVNRRGGQVRPLSLGHNTLKWGAIVAGFLVVSMVLVGGWVGTKIGALGLDHATTAQSSNGPSIAALSEWSLMLADQEDRLGALQRESGEEARALSRRLGILQAQITRLEAAGTRLAELSGLDAGEFDFQAPLAVGGPEVLIDDQDGEPSSSDLHRELTQTEAQIRDRARQLRVLEDLLVVSRQQKESQPQGRPVKTGFVSSLFGHRRDPISGRRTIHEGIDFAAHTGTDIYSVGSGIVIMSGMLGAYGRVVEINHGNGYVTRYAHASASLVKVGERVTKGQVIAKVGTTGRSTGPHLHFEVFYNGRVVNPQRYIQAAR
jgi:murein DD-endopeptidase MepM/ murein hydrolase activator NlpD